MSLVNKLSKEKIEECKNVFNLNDTSKKGFIPSLKLPSILRNLGAYVPQENLEEFIGNRKEIKYDKFINFFAEYYTKKVDKKQLIKGLSFLDKDRDGNISSLDLRHALTTIGEKLTEDEAYDLLKTYTDKNGMIDYSYFANEISKQ